MWKACDCAEQIPPQEFSTLYDKTSPNHEYDMLFVHEQSVCLSHQDDISMEHERPAGDAEEQYWVAGVPCWRPVWGRCSLKYQM